VAVKSFRSTKFTKLLNRLPARARFLAGQKYRL
jgi:hypothetical protein